jgi:hypothetical protein
LQVISSGKSSVEEKTSPSNSSAISVGVGIASVAGGALGDGALTGVTLHAVNESARKSAVIFSVSLRLDFLFVVMLHPFFGFQEIVKELFFNSIIESIITRLIWLDKLVW